MPINSFVVYNKDNNLVITIINGSPNGTVYYVRTYSNGTLISTNEVAEDAEIDINVCANNIDKITIDKT